MQQTVFVPIAAFLLVSVAILANKPQNPGSTDWDSKLEADICMVDTLHARAMIKVHPDDWRERLDEMRRNASAMYEKCDKHLMSQGETEIRDFLEYGRQCNMNTQFTVVAIVFIVLFLLALTGMIGFAVLYFRFGK